MKTRQYTSNDLTEEMTMRAYFHLLYSFCALLVPLIMAASYSNCGRSPSDKLLFRRVVQQGPTALMAVEYVNFPELLIDRKQLKEKASITCIKCLDKHPEQQSMCKIIAGGVGHTFVKFKVVSLPERGYSYEILVYGREDE